MAGRLLIHSGGLSTPTAILLVGAGEFEPPASCSQTRREATRLPAGMPKRAGEGQQQESHPRVAAFITAQSVDDGGLARPGAGSLRDSGGRVLPSLRSWSTAPYVYAERRRRRVQGDPTCQQVLPVLMMAP